MTVDSKQLAVDSGQKSDDLEYNHMCENCECIISEDEWLMFNGLCEECVIEEEA